VRQPPALEGGYGLFDQGPGAGPVDLLLTGRERVPPAAVGHLDRAAGTLVALLGPAGQVDRTTQR
jgi:hypothetical protein